MNSLATLVILLGLGAAPAEAEQTDVEHWARALRIQVYETFRADRAEFDRRRQEAQRVIADWEAAGQRAEDREQLIEWLQQATRVSQSGSVNALPEAPHFGAAKTTPQPAVSSARPSGEQNPPVVSKTVEPAPVETKLPPAIVEPPAPKFDSVESQPPPPVDVAPQPQANPAPTASDRHIVPPQVDGPRTQINLVELSARLTGYNRGVRDLEIELSGERTRTASELATAVDELADLARRAHDLGLYREHVVAPDERENLPSLASLQDAISSLGDRIFAARKEASEASNGCGGEALRQAELDTLDGLSRRLAEIATRQ